MQPRSLVLHEPGPEVIPLTPFFSDFVFRGILLMCTASCNSLVPCGRPNTPRVTILRGRSFAPVIMLMKMAESYTVSDVSCKTLSCLQNIVLYLCLGCSCQKFCLSTIMPRFARPATGWEEKKAVRQFGGRFRGRYREACAWRKREGGDTRRRGPVWKGTAVNKGGR